MAESTCLLRSFSHPAANSREAQQGDPYQALTESISLGRFMSEPLAWEKWSTFSHNRYLEEAEKISRPGTVAERKAYFEAHYKRKAAERAAALLQDVNGVENVVPALETRVGECNNSFLERKSAGDIQASSSEQQYSDSSEAVDTAGVRDDSEIKLDESGILEMGEESVLQHDLNVDVCEQGNCDIERNEMDVDSREEASLISDDSEIILNESSILKRGEKPVLQHYRDVDASEQGNSDIERNAMENNKMEIEVQALQSIHNTDLSLKSCSPVNDINQSDDVKRNDNVVKLEEIRKTNENTRVVLDVKTNKRAESSSTKLKIGSSIPKPLRSIMEQKVSMNPRDSTIDIPKTKKPVGNLVDKRRSTPKSFHVSVDLTYCTGQRSKTRTLISEQNSERKNNAVSSNVPKRSPVCSQNPTRGSVSGILKKPPPANPLSQCRSSSSSATRSHARPPIMSFPFRFRSEERAENRKKSLEEKSKPKEAEKVQFETRFKEKVEHKSKKLCQSSVYSSRLNDDANCRSESSISNANKIPFTWPRSPKPERKLASSSTQETRIRRSWKPPTASSKSKDVPNHNLSVTLLPEKSTIENASPKLGRKLASSSTQETSIRHSWRPPTAASKSKDVPNHHLHAMSLSEKSVHENASPKLGRKLASSSFQETSIRHSWRPPTAASKSKDVPSHNLHALSLPEKSTHENVSPKLGRKLASSSTRERSIRCSWRPPTASSKSKDVLNHNLSDTSLPEKSIHENASPNIQH